MLLVAYLSALSAQTVDLECNFVYTLALYTCELSDIIVTDPEAQYNFGGEHLENRTNDNVDRVAIQNSNTPFIIPEIFTAFPNITELLIRESGLESIEFPPTHQLRRIFFSYNRIGTLKNATFANQSNLTHLNLNRNHIAVIEEDAFIGLDNVETIFLIANNLTELPGRIFANIPSLTTLDLENNNLTRIEAATFAENRQLWRLYLEYNEITAIEPTFLRNLTGLNYVNLRGNECVQNGFFFDDEFDTIRFHQSLADCYEGFTPRSPNEDRSMTMEFAGQLNVYDAFNNIIAVINQQTDDGSSNSTTSTVDPTETTSDFNERIITGF